VIELILFFFYSLLLWLGIYIIQRDIKNTSLLLIGLSLFFSAIYYGGEILSNYSMQSNIILIATRDICFYLSLLLLLGAILSHLPISSTKQSLLMKIWGYLLSPLLFIASLNLFFLQKQTYFVYYRILLALALSTLLIFLIITFTTLLKKWNQRLQKTLLLFGLSIYLGTLVVMLFDFDADFLFMLNSVGFVGIAFTLFTVEIAEQGERWFLDFIYSFDYTFLTTTVITGQVILAIWIGSSFSFETIFLVLLSILISILTQASFRHIQTGFEYFVFIAFPQIRQERSRLRTTESVKLVINEKACPEQMDEEQLYRLTRRAFSNFGDLQRLSANPLTQLKIIDQRLKSKEKSKDVLERANELKSLLLECVQQLKPKGNESFGTTDEWRYYNSLYFPYIVGIKPYRLRYSDHQLSEEAKAALEWFRTCVPERTFYNWTNAAARLVSVHLIDQSFSSKR
jgi:hypothetical protein